VLPGLAAAGGGMMSVVRYTVTLTEWDRFTGDPDAEMVRASSHTGEAFEVLALALDPRHDWRDISVGIRRGTNGARVGRRELIEDARVNAVTPHTRQQWVDAMVTLVRSWVYPWDDGYPMDPPPDQYWQQAGRWWAERVTVPPPDDVITALGEDPDLDGHSIFVDVARQHARTTSVATSAVRHASAALTLTGTAGVQPHVTPSPPNQSAPSPSPRHDQGRGR
jgi:hypothetical protein